MVARTFFPASSSIENIPALNFSTTIPTTSIESSFGKVFLFPVNSRKAGATCWCAPPALMCFCLPTVLPRAAAPATRSTAARSAIRLRAGFVDVQRSAIQVLAVETVDRRVSFRIHAHFDKSEASGLPRITISDDVNSIDAAVRLKNRPDGLLGSSKTEITYKDVFQFILLSDLQTN
jgi:hypothetical protein